MLVYPFGMSESRPEFKDRKARKNGHHKNPQPSWKRHTYKHIAEYDPDHYDSLLDFFNLDKLNRNINMKLWNNVNDYRSFFEEKSGIKPPLWQVGRTSSSNKLSRIDILSYKEFIKCI